MFEDEQRSLFSATWRQRWAPGRLTRVVADPPRSFGRVVTTGDTETGSER